MSLVGKEIGRWSVISVGEPYHNPSNNHVATRYICRCSCGTERNVRETSLLSGDSTSCGCYRDEAAGTHAVTHGMSDNVLYGVWRDMNRRCYLPSRKDYKHYGGRGIAVAKEWQDDEGLINFINDMFRLMRKV